MIVDKIKKREPTAKRKENKVDIPVGKWVKCDKCKEIIYKETIRENMNICPNCGGYFRMHINRRLESIIDEGTYQKFDLNIDTTNPLNLEDYPKKIKALREKTGLQEAVSAGKGKINGEDVVICVMDSGFLMGSMGVVVGEKITYSIEKAIELKLPIIIHDRDAHQDTFELIKNTKKNRTAIYNLVQGTLDVFKYRILAHNLTIDNRVLADGEKVECAASLVRSAIMNVLDNSIYWLEKYEIKDKKILFVEYVPESGYRGLLIVDNGKGFTIPKDKLTLPFISKKEDGMGLGLHLVNEIMDTIGGKVIFPDVLDFDLPIDYENGAAVALIFKEA